jgi:hypothetical protein
MVHDSKFAPKVSSSVHFVEDEMRAGHAIALLRVLPGSSVNYPA